MWWTVAVPGHVSLRIRGAEPGDSGYSLRLIQDSFNSLGLMTLMTLARPIEGRISEAPESAR
jgi:hypothetical protein